MPIDLDRYYTPEGVAMEALERAELPVAPTTCADSTCGSGRLLDAASAVFGPVQCVGVDQDRNAIAMLRKSRPNWHLTVADLLKSKNRLKSFSSGLPSPIDLLIINPPFSQRAQKSIEIEYQGLHLRASVAMAHLLRSLETFNPGAGAIAVVPESLLYSETDSVAREVIGKNYSFSSIMELKSCTFSGARVNSSIIRISPESKIEVHAKFARILDSIEISLVRGSLPVHLSNPGRIGIPYVHSTGIRWIAEGGDLLGLPKTLSQAKGRVSGWMILLPRVGKPDSKLIKPVYLKSVVQLSDCVIGVLFSNKHEAFSGMRRIKQNWDEFLMLYKGTGARYTTTARLESWLAEIAGLVVRK